jgi:hypothetical protein
MIRALLRWLLRLFVLLLFVVPLAVGVLAWKALEKAPLVRQDVAFTPAHIERARALLARHDPRTLRPGVLRTLVLTESELDLAANYLASRWSRGSSRVALLEGSADLAASFEMPVNPVGRFLNVQATLVQTPGLPALASLRIGQLEVPPALRDWLVRQAIGYLQSRADVDAATGMVRSVVMGGQSLRLQFVWNDRALDQLRAALVPPAEQQRLEAYQRRLVALAADGAASRSALRLEALLEPLLALAEQRSSGTGTGTGSGDWAAEHRAAIVALAFYVNGQGLDAIVPDAKAWTPPVPRRVLMAGRTDTPLHFMVSAAVAASAGSPLADAVGLYKELADARGGSGFSFNDLAADRAGTRFGALAVQPALAAPRLQRLRARGLREADLLPDIRDLPEFLGEDEFKRRFGGVDQPAYRRVVSDIERRIGALALYR